MTKNELLGKIESIIDSVKAAILATIDLQGKPRMRWMTPVMLPGETQTFYAVTSPKFNKIKEILNQPSVEWLLQTRDLREIIHVRGRINILENPALRARVMERIANHLTMLWKLEHDPADYIVLETVIEEAVHFIPMKGEKTSFVFYEGKHHEQETK